MALPAALADNYNKLDDGTALISNEGDLVDNQAPSFLAVSSDVQGGYFIIQVDDSELTLGQKIKRSFSGLFSNLFSISISQRNAANSASNKPSAVAARAAVAAEKKSTYKTTSSKGKSTTTTSTGSTSTTPKGNSGFLTSDGSRCSGSNCVGKRIETNEGSGTFNKNPVAAHIDEGGNAYYQDPITKDIKFIEAKPNSVIALDLRKTDEGYSGTTASYIEAPILTPDDIVRANKLRAAKAGNAGSNQRTVNSNGNLVSRHGVNIISSTPIGQAKDGHLGVDVVLHNYADRNRVGNIEVAAYKKGDNVAVFSFVPLAITQIKPNCNPNEKNVQSFSYSLAPDEEVKKTFDVELPTGTNDYDIVAGLYATCGQGYCNEDNVCSWNDGGKLDRRGKA